jgi:hypothetical protein
MATITAVVTDDGLEYLPQMWAGLVTFKIIDEFKVGEGGWVETSGGRVPRTPDPTLQDLDIIENPGRYPADSVGTFTKAVTGFTWNSGTKTLDIECLVDFGEFNDDGNGNNPEIYEIGIYSDHPTAGKIMVAYGTMAEEISHPGRQINNTVQIVFQR